jgi:hypothetical protein
VSGFAVAEVAKTFGIAAMRKLLASFIVEAFSGLGRHAQEL